MDSLKLLCRERVNEHELARLRAGDPVEIDGELLTVRDASAKRLAGMIARREPLDVDLSGRLLYACGPSPAKPGYPVGAAGPTTTDRIARFLPALLEVGVRGVIGKGELGGEAAEAFARHRAVYFAAIGGLGALLAERITAAEVVAFPDLGSEAVYRFEVVKFPVVVILDSEGANFHTLARSAWRRV
jgi:fumarate hydratase subunit beta